MNILNLVNIQFIKEYKKRNCSEKHSKKLRKIKTILCSNAPFAINFGRKVLRGIGGQQNTYSKFLKLRLKVGLQNHFLSLTNY